MAIQQELQVDKQTVTDWANFLREVCSTELVRNPIHLGGPGHTVAVDETLVAKRKPGNQQGRPVAAKWVFGAVDLGTSDFFMEIVDQRDAAQCPPGTNNQKQHPPRNDNLERSVGGIQQPTKSGLYSPDC